MRLYTGGLVAALICCFATARSASAEPDVKPPIRDAADAALEPEEVLRRFFYALVTKDKATIQRYVVPHPDAELLWQGEPASEQLRAAVRKNVEKLHFKRLKVGDKVSAPGGREYVVEELQVNENRVLLWPDGFTLPIALVRRADGWRVKADSFIDERRKIAAEEAAKKTGPRAPPAADGSNRN